MIKKVFLIIIMSQDKYQSLCVLCSKPEILVMLVHCTGSLHTHCKALTFPFYLIYGICNFKHEIPI